MLPLLLKSQENLQDFTLVITPTDNLNEDIEIPLPDYKTKESDNIFKDVGWRLKLSFTNHPILSNIFFKKTSIRIRFLKELDRNIHQQIANIVGDMGILSSSSFLLTFNPDDIINIYNDLFIPFLQFNMSDNVTNNIIIESEYSIDMDNVDDNILIGWLNKYFNYNMHDLEINDYDDDYDYDEYNKLYGAINNKRITRDLNKNYLFYLPELNIGDVEVDIYVVETAGTATHFYLESFTTFVL